MNLWARFEEDCETTSDGKHIGCSVDPCRCDEIRGLIGNLYCSNLQFTRCKPAPSLVWRSELAMWGEDSPRWANRCHVFEGTGGPHRYLGFFHLRPKWREPSPKGDLPLLAEAFLAPPARMLHPPYHLPTLGPYGTYYGLPNFGCAPFARPHKLFGGFCAQACLFASMVISSRVSQTKVVGPFEITALAQPESKSEYKSGFDVRGLNPLELVDVLRSPYVGANGLVDSIDTDTPTGRKMAMTYLCTYLSHGFPIILPVNYNQLHQKKTKEPEHAILLLGYAMSSGKDFGRVVFHDSAIGPYQEIDFLDLVNATLNSGRMEFIVPVARQVKMSLTDAEEYCKAEKKCKAPSNVFRFRLVPGRSFYDTYLRNPNIIWDIKEPANFFMQHLQWPDYVWVKEFYADTDRRSRDEFNGLWILDSTLESGHDEEQRALIGSFEIHSNEGYFKFGRDSTCADVAVTQRSIVSEEY